MTMSRPRKVFFRRRKVCKFCADKIDYIDYKDVKLLQQFIPERSKILPRRISGTCATDQRHLGRRGETVEVKPGYGRNFLLPQGVALEATPGNQKLFEQQRKKIDA